MRGARTTVQHNEGRSVTELREINQDAVGIHIALLNRADISGNDRCWRGALI